MSKYNTLNENPFSVHQKIVQLVGEQKKVLDVGCATGHVSKKLYTNKCDVIGIELDEKSSQEAHKYCEEVIIGDVESIELKDKYLNYFDFIIFADVL
jgi:2-polyprenyl-3-methyl-5-hydroxy-6-metoxy-1,4-benzoquinol methylase